MIFGEDTFTFKPADFYPFKDTKGIDRVRAITKEDILAMNGKHPACPTMQVDVFRNDEIEMVMIADIVKRIIDSDRYDKRCVMIMPNPQLYLPQGSLSASSAQGKLPQCEILHDGRMGRRRRQHCPSEDEFFQY